MGGVQSCTRISKGTDVHHGCITLYRVWVQGRQLCDLDSVNHVSLYNKALVCELSSSVVVCYSLCWSLLLFCTTCEAKMSQTQANMRVNGTFRILRMSFGGVLASVHALVQSAALWSSLRTSPVEEN